MLEGCNQLPPRSPTKTCCAQGIVQAEGNDRDKDRRFPALKKLASLWRDFKKKKSKLTNVLKITNCNKFYGRHRQKTEKMV